jgi:very-short-patch-repair endonuclease
MVEKVVKYCPVCNKKMEFEPSLAKRRTYCSLDCYHNSLKGRPSPKDKRLKKKCRFCNKEFLTKRSMDNKYCSSDCYWKDKTGKAITWLKGGRPGQRATRIVKPCLYCGKQLELTPTQAKRKNYCSRKCYSKSLSGRKFFDSTRHSPWNKGKTGEDDIRLKNKYKGKRSEEIYGIERSEKIKSILRESNYRQLKSGKFKTSNTGIEKIMKAELIKLGFRENEDFFHQYPFKDKKYVCDFAFPKQKIVIECQGDFHHANPEINWDHNPAASDKELDNSFLYPMQIKQIKKDRAKKAYIEKSGWVFFEAWGAELNNLAERTKVISKIKRLIEERNQI